MFICNLPVSISPFSSPTLSLPLYLSIFLSNISRLCFYVIGTSFFLCLSQFCNCGSNDFYFLSLTAWELECNLFHLLSFGAIFYRVLPCLLRTRNKNRTHIYILINQYMHKIPTAISFIIISFRLTGVNFYLERKSVVCFALTLTN